MASARTISGVVVVVEPGGRGDLEVDPAAHQLQPRGLERDRHGANLIRYRLAVEQAATRGGRQQARP